MSRSLVGSLISISMLLSASLQGQMANKSFVTPRNELQHEGRDWVMSEPHRLNRARVSRYGITSQVTLFHSKTTNEQGLGEQFGAADRADRADANATVKVVLDETKDTNALYGRHIDHTFDQDNNEAPMYGVLNLAPWQERNGAIIDLRWEMAKATDVLRGWHIGVTVPVVQVTNNMGLTFTKDGRSVTGTNKNKGGTLAEFFDGTYDQLLAGNWQQKLTHGLIDTLDRQSTGIADIKLNVSYGFDVHRDSAVQLKAGLVLPTGNKSTAVDMFEALYGNNGHVGISAGGAAMMRITSNEAKGTSWWMSSTAEYTFLFQAREKRVLGLYDTTAGKTWAWGQYALGLEKGKGSVFPLANVLARDVYVTPGSHFDGIFGLTWVWNKLHVNVGYNVYYRQSEDVKLVSDWPMDRYGVALFAHDAGNAGIISGTDATGPIQPNGMTTTHLEGVTVPYYVDPAVCTSSHQDTQSLLLSASYAGRFGAIGYWGRVGASYELAYDASKALSQYAVYGAVGFSF